MWAILLDPVVLGVTAISTYVVHKYDVWSGAGASTDSSTVASGAGTTSSFSLVAKALLLLGIGYLIHEVLAGVKLFGGKR